jgi:hypothetical protein
MAEGFRHPSLLGGTEMEGFLTHLAVERHAAASTPNQALNARRVLYRNLGPLPNRCNTARPSLRKHATN